MSLFIGQQVPGSVDEAFLTWPVLSWITVNGYPLVSFVFNLALLLVPLAAQVGLDKLLNKDKKLSAWTSKLMGGLLFLVWLIFIPNTAYIITDVRHLLVPGCAVDSFYRVCAAQPWPIILFFTYGLLGWLSWVYLVRRWRRSLVKVYGRTVGWWFVWCLPPLVALGVLLGLVERWNSWQLLTSTRLVAASAGSYFTDPAKLLNWLIFTICLYLLYFGGAKLLVDETKKQ